MTLFSCSGTKENQHIIFQGMILAQYVSNFCLCASVIKSSSFETWNILLNFDQSFDQLLNLRKVNTGVSSVLCSSEVVHLTLWSFIVCGFQGSLWRQTRRRVCAFFRHLPCLALLKTSSGIMVTFQLQVVMSRASLVKMLLVILSKLYMRWFMSCSSRECSSVMSWAWRIISH